MYSEIDLTLELLVCTLDEGINKIPHLLCAEQENVFYLISHQISNGKVYNYSFLTEGRKDIRVITVNGKGLSVNRNNALKNAKGSILLLADDDNKYEPIFFDRIIEGFKKNPKADIICFKALNEKKEPLRCYSSSSFYYSNQPYGAYFLSVEIAMRNLPNLPSFDLRFGLGNAFLPCGEEEVFLFNAHKKGLTILFWPAFIVQTKSARTSDAFSTSDGLQRAKGAVLCIIHGRFGALLRSFSYSFMKKRSENKCRLFKNLLEGINYIVRTSHE